MVKYFFIKLVNNYTEIFDILKSEKADRFQSRRHCLDQGWRTIDIHNRGDTFDNFSSTQKFEFYSHHIDKISFLLLKIKTFFNTDRLS